MTHFRLSLHLPALAALLLAALAPPLAAQGFDMDRWVNMSGEDTGNCASLLQACRTPGYALSVANPGDVIFIARGEYAQGLVIDRDVTLIGEGPGRTILRAPGLGDGAPATRTVTIDGPWQVQLHGLTLRDGAAHAANQQFDGGGIHSLASRLTLANVRIEDNRSTRLGGGIYHAGNVLILRNTVVAGNYARHLGNEDLTRGGGIHVAAGQAMIVNSTVVGNDAERGGGLALAGSAQAWLLNSIVWFNRSWRENGHEIQLAGSTGLVIQHSIFRNRPGEDDVVGNGIHVDGASRNEDPMWLSSNYQHDRDYGLRPMSPAINAGLNTLYGTGGGDPAGDLDHIGGRRVWNYSGGGVIDIGAYEFQGEPAELAAPELDSPADRAVAVPAPYTLAWHPVPQADSYQVQVAVAGMSVDFSDPVIDAISTTTQFDAAGLEPLADYDWRVRPVMNGFVGEWSAPWRFATQGTLAPGPGTILHIAPQTRGDGSGRNWANAHGSLANALKWAAHNEGRGLWDADNPLQIWVGKGHYRPRYRPEDLLAVPPYTFQASLVLVPDVQVYGGFNSTDPNADMDSRDPEAYPTIIGDDSGSGGIYHNLVIAAGPLGSARLDGFTLTGGHARGEILSLVRGEEINRTLGGAIHLANSSPTLARLLITGNQATNFGGGIHAIASHAHLDRVRIQDNSVSLLDGGGLYIYQGDLLITNSLISGNHANSTGGGIVVHSGRLHLVNSTVTGNLASRGGGINNFSGVVDMDNSILWGNQGNLSRQYAETAGSGLWRHSLAGNAANDLDESHGLVFEQVLHADPQFTDPQADDFLPGPGSPARDRGSNALHAAVTGAVTDLAGRPRIVNGTIDLGPLEIQSGPPDVIFRDGFEQAPR